MKIQHVLNCSFSSWYPIFRDVTIKSRILDIPPDVLEYLLSDGTLVLPAGSHGATCTEEADKSDDETDWSSGLSSAEVQLPSFPDFEASIKQCIKALGGNVFPKLNWSSPKDATWIALNNTLTCTNVGDIFLLLKSSQFITHDLTQPFERCEDFEPSQKNDVKYQLVLRRWHDLNPGGEFRCFVKNNQLVGICQRHVSCYYGFIKPHKDDIVQDIMEFYNRSIKGKFTDSTYVFDVYRKTKSKVYLIDFNPFGEVTDGLMFTWEELKSNKPLNSEESNSQEENREVAFRYLSSSDGVQPSPYSSYGLPVDFVDLSTGSDPYKLMDFLQLKLQSQEQEDDGDDSTDKPDS